MTFFCLSFSAEAQEQKEEGITHKIDALNEDAVYLIEGPAEEAQLGLEKALQAQTLATKHEYAQGLAQAMDNLGRYYSLEGYSERALEYYQGALSLNIKLDNEAEMMNQLLGMSIIYHEKANYSEALKLALDAMKKAERIKDTYQQGAIANQLGLIYADLGNNVKAIEYMDRTFDLAKKHGNDWGVAMTLSNMAGVYLDQKDYDRAKSLYISGLTILDTLGDEFETRFIKAGLAEIHLAEGELDRALGLAQERIDLERKFQDDEGLARAYALLSEIHLERKELPEALRNAESSLRISKTLDVKSAVSRSYRTLSYVHEAMGQAQKALEYEREFVTLRDSIYGENNQKQLAEVQAVYELDKKEREIELLNKNKELHEVQFQRERLHRNALIAGGSLVFLVLVVVAWRYYDKNRANVLLEKKRRQLEDANGKLSIKNVQVIQQKEEIQAQRDNIEQQKEELMAAYGHIKSSINYASRIQQAMFPRPELIKALLPESFILHKARDVVSGDFYWMTRIGSKTVVSAADCTGHGVPGAFMSMAGDAYLNQIVKLQGITSPAKILEELHAHIRTALQQEETENRDGMDMSVVVIDDDERTLTYAGAKSPLVYVKGSKKAKISADKLSVGGKTMGAHHFREHVLQIDEPITFYLFSDGYQDQFGGKYGRKFMSKRFRETLFKIHELPMPKQEESLRKMLRDWVGFEYRQIDDILIIGARVS